MIAKGEFSQVLEAFGRKRPFPKATSKITLAGTKSEVAGRSPKSRETKG